MTDKNYPDTRQWVQDRAPAHFGSNIRRYKWTTWIGQPKANMLGGLSFLGQKEGKVVDMDDDLVLLKTAPSEVCVVAKDLLTIPVELDCKVKLSFYDLRDFDGLKSDGSEDPADHSGCKSYMLTGAKTLMPAIWGERGEWSRKTVKSGWTAIQNPYLQDLIEQMERISVGAGRNLVNVLVDANGTTPTYIDPPEEHSAHEDNQQWPAILTTVNSAKFRGDVAIRYNRGADTYEVEFTPNLGEKQLFDNVLVCDLQTVLVEGIEDGSWQNVKVEVLKAAPKKKRVPEPA